jgi:transposase
MSDTLVSTVCFGVGIDTARYGHHASFLNEDRQPATRGFLFAESTAGYQQFQEALARLAARHDGHVHFYVRLDAAGQYAANLEAFLRRLPFSTTISVGEPKRNKDYRNAHFPKRKSDAADSMACARFAIVERPAATSATPPEFLPLRELAGALQSQRTQTTRRVNQLHNHLARVFPELAVLAANVAADWVLKLLHKYPAAQRIAAARIDSLTRIPHLDSERAQALQAAARASTGSLRGPFAEQLVRHLVAEVRQSRCAELTLESLLEQAFQALPPGGHLQLLTIPGIGLRTAAALTAKIISIDRFRSPEALVSYFGVFPEENTSGVDKHGKPVPAGTLRMSLKGNDLVRGLLWMACQSAIQCNPAIRALYARQKALGKRGDVALGHCLRKMLHLVFALWKTNRPFDPQRHVELPPHEEQAGTAVQPPIGGSEPGAQEAAAGRNGQCPEEKAVTAADTHLATRIVPPSVTGHKHNAPAPTHKAPRRGPTRRIDFARLRRQISMTDVLEHLGALQRLQGQGAQRRGPCPIHGKSAGDGRTFSVNLDKHVFRCLDPNCNAHGNVLDLWAAIQQLPLRDAALHLAATFQIPIDQTTNATSGAER